RRRRRSRNSYPRFWNAQTPFRAAWRRAAKFKWRSIFRRTRNGWRCFRSGGGGDLPRGARGTHSTMPTSCSCANSDRPTMPSPTSRAGNCRIAGRRRCCSNAGRRIFGAPQRARPRGDEAVRGCCSAAAAIPTRFGWTHLQRQITRSVAWQPRVGRSPALSWSPIVSINKDQVEGRAKEATGKVQEVAGKTVGSKEQQIKSNIHKNEGAAQAKFGDIKSHVKDS